MKERRDTSSADLAAASVGKRKRTKKKPLWCRIIYEDPMVALVRLLGHDGMPHKELRDKAKPLIEKFGRERLEEAAAELVEYVGDGDDAIVRLTEQARKFAIQLIGRPRTENATEPSVGVPAEAQSPAPIESKAIQPSTEIISAAMACEPNLLPSTKTSSAQQTASEAVAVESSPLPTHEQMKDDSQDWTNYETSYVAAFLNQDRDFADECLHLAKMCCERAPQCEPVTADVQSESQARTRLLANELQRLVSAYNPLAEEDVSPFSDLLEAALSNVDWQELADSYLKRLTEECGND